MKEGCEDCRKWEEHFYWHHTHGGKVRFIKNLALEDFRHRLSLPKKFVSNIGGRLPEMIELKGPSGSIWNVNLKIVDGGIFLEAGWKEFAEAHSLERGDSLVFTYKENSHFKVLLFNGYGCEKEHSYFVKNCVTKNMRERSKDGRTEGQVNSSTQEAYGFNSHTPETDQHAAETPQRSKDGRTEGQVISSTQEAYEFNSHTPETEQCAAETPQEMHLSWAIVVKNKHEIICSDSSEEDSVSAQEDSMFPNINTGSCRYNSGIHRLEQEQKNRQNNLTEGPCTTLRSAPKKRNATEEDRNKALELASAVRLERPAFLSVMRPSHVSRRFVLVIPQKFVKNYLPSQHETFLIRNPEGRSWKVNYIAGKRLCTFSKGWMVFAEDNKLEEGDVCVFELASDTDNRVMNCHFFRAAQDMQQPEMRVSSPDKRIKTDVGELEN